MKKLRKIFLFLVPLFCAASAFEAYAAAETRAVPYESYTYTYVGDEQRAAPAPASYMPEAVLSGEDFNAGALNQPGDLFKSWDNKLYITDTGNKRIVVLNEDFSLNRIIDSFTDENGEPFEFMTPRGLFAAKDGRIHIADTERREVITINADGKIINRIVKPESDLLGRDFNLSPVAVLEDQTGVVYVLSQGCFQGALMIDPARDNAFLGFYGASEVEMTLERMAERVWKMLFTREQRTRMAQFIPIEYTNFMIDDENFIYTCSAYTENNNGQIRKLNALGENIMRTHSDSGTVNYGDPISYDGTYTRVTTAFVDITCDEDGFISALDRTRGRVFQYDEDSAHICVFGKIGEQDGCFTNPVALESFGGKLCVLDAAKNSLTIFKRTAYGEDVHQASVLYQDGRYEESLELWRGVLAQNANYERAYLGVGLGLAKTGELEDALWYARQAQRRSSYDDILEEYRKEFMKEHFDTIATALAAAAALGVLFRFRKRLPGRARREG